jgi:agmatine deiminase
MSQTDTPTALDPMTQTEIPAALGFHMPAEWAKHDATWIAWPHHKEDWPGKFGPIPWVFTEIVRHLSRAETVNILVDGKSDRNRAADRLDRAGIDADRVVFHKVRTDRVWTRDTGPTFVVNPKLPGPLAVGMVDWRFNGWAKYDNHKRDQRVTRKIADRLGLNCWTPEVEVDKIGWHVVLEGGSIDVNGKGTLITTEECLLSDVQARNPGIDKIGLEEVLADYLGISKVIWLGRGIFGDDTHGHVDDLARFVDPTTVVTVVEPNMADENHEPLKDNLERLQSATDQDGNPLRIVELPMPRPVIFEGQRLPASYANFYIANGLVLVPTFNDTADRVALDTLAGLFPDRQVVGIHSVDLVWGLGTIHCLTQQQPSAPEGEASST